MNRSDQAAIVLYFDETTEAAVRGLSGRLVADGIAPATSTPIRPHLTVAVCTGLDARQFQPVLADIAARTPTLPLALGGVGAFPTEQGVIFLVPAASHALIQAKQRVIRRLSVPGCEVNPYFRAGAWVPHVTLAVGIPRERMAAAFDVCLETFRPIPGHLLQLAVVEIGSDAPGYTVDLRAR